MNVSFPSNKKIPNPVHRTAVIWRLIALLLLVGIFLPHLLGVDPMQWGYGISFLCIIFGITSVIVAIMYQSRARMLEKILSGQNLLVHWTYTPEEWDRYSEKEHEINKRDKRNLFFLVVVMCVIVGIIMYLVKGENGGIIFFIVLGIIAVVGVAAFLSIWLPQRNNRNHLGEAFIATEGVYLNRVLHLWRGFGAELEDVSYEVYGRPMLRIDYSTPNRGGRVITSVRIPVPQGQEDKVDHIVSAILDARLNNKNKSGKQG